MGRTAAGNSRPSSTSDSAQLQREASLGRIDWESPIWLITWVAVLTWESCMSSNGHIGAFVALLDGDVGCFAHCVFRLDHVADYKDVGLFLTVGTCDHA